LIPSIDVGLGHRRLAVAGYLKLDQAMSDYHFAAIMCFEKLAMNACFRVASASNHFFLSLNVCI